MIGCVLLGRPGGLFFNLIPLELPIIPITWYLLFSIITKYIQQHIQIEGQQKVKVIDCYIAASKMPPRSHPDNHPVCLKNSY